MAADGGSVIRMRKKNANWAQNMAKRIPYVVLKERVERSKPPLKSVVVNGTFGDGDGDGSGEEYPQDCPPQDWPHGGQS